MKSFESFETDDIKYMLKRAEKNGDIVIKTNADSVLKNLHEIKIGSFESLILKNPNNSVVYKWLYKEHITELIDKFGGMGLDVSELKKLNKGYLERHFNIDERISELLYDGDPDFETEEERDKEVERLQIESDQAETKMEEVKKEIIKLKEQAHKILTD